MIPPAPAPRTGPERRRGAVLAAAVAAACALVPALVLILLGHNAGRAAWDSTVYHEPFIRQLARDWPAFDLSDPLTATTPGYHVLLATLAAAGPDSTAALRLASAAIGAALAALVAGWCARRVGPRDAVLLALPLACSLYVLGSTAWLLPDNLAWLGVAAIVMLALRETAGLGTTLAAAAVLLPLVLTRQIHLWAAGVVCLAAWFSARPPGTPAFSHIPARLPRTALAALLTIPSFLLVAWFVRHWGGLTPPRFQSDIGGVNPATPAFILVQVAILTLGFGPWLLPAVLRAARDRPGVLLAGAGIAVALALIPPTTHDQDAGRYSGWWSLVRAAPALGDRTSLLVLVLAPVGGAVLAGAVSPLRPRPRWVLIGALVAFAAAQSATINAWQRYHEPFLIILLALLAALQPPELRVTALARLRLPAMGALCLVLSAVALQGLRGEPIAPGTTPPAKHTSPDDPWAAPPDNPPEPPPEAGVQSDPGQADAPPGR